MFPYIYNKKQFLSINDSVLNKRYFFRPERNMLLLVKWEDGTTNTVSSKDLEYNKTKNLSGGLKVKMYWPPEKKNYYGIIIQTQKEFNMKQNILNESLKVTQQAEVMSDSESENISLAVVKEHLKNKKALIPSSCESPNIIPLETNTPPGEIETDSENENIPLAAIKNQMKIKNMLIPLPGKSTNSLSVKNDSQSMDGVPKLKTSNKSQNNYHTSESEEDPFAGSSDEDPSYTQKCQFKNCKIEIFAACERCEALLCWEHFIHNDNCNNHDEDEFSDDQEAISTNKKKKRKELSSSLLHEYAVDGEKREVPLEKVQRINQKKIAKALRAEGKSYVSSVLKKHIPEKILKQRCNSQRCMVKSCNFITEKERHSIFHAFYGTKSLHLQREFIVRHVNIKRVKRRRTPKGDSRRTRTLEYFLPRDSGSVPVCKTMFLNTLAISEKVMRTAVNKRTSDGVILPDKRGGRYENLKEKDEVVRAAVLAHINKFPKMESHFCRKSTSKEYLHPDLNIKKMFYLYKEENEQPKCSYHTYRRVFKSLHVSFHHPKKDQCSLCLSYREGNAAKKLELHDEFTAHTTEKNAVRKKKEEAKEMSKTNTEIAAAVFDLQQVIQLPINKESALYYRRRLSVFNFTIYNVGNKECYCFLWSEVISRRGSNEISTCVAKYLHQLDNQGLKEVRLFADGCAGQNKNTIVFTMLLHFIVNSKHVQQVVLSFFETNHGQSEGDSAHSCISTAISAAGDIFIPSQLPPIIRLARRNFPYVVFEMDTEDFLDYKSCAEKIRLRATKITDSGENIDWTKIKEVMVNKDNVNVLNIKRSHVDAEYQKVSLKRLPHDVLQKSVPKLNTGHLKLAANKYKDLNDLCTGRTPVIRNKTFQLFFKDLPHE